MASWQLYRSFLHEPDTVDTVNSDAGDRLRINFRRLADALMDGGTSVKHPKYGAVGDGVTNDRAAFASALSDIASAGRGRLFIPAGTYYLPGAALSVPSNCGVLAADGTILQVEAGRAVALLDLDGVTNVYLCGFAIEKASGAVAAGTAYGINIRGACAHVTVERVRTGGTSLPASGSRGDGMVSGVHVAGNEGTVSGTATDLAFSRVTCNNSPNVFGFWFDDCGDVLLDDCRGQGNWLDGCKLRKSTTNVTIRGGNFSNNGWGYTSDPVTYAGDGIDAYSGGDTFTVDGTVLTFNYGSGITVKTGEDSVTGLALGRVKNVRLRNLNASNNRAGNGVYITENNPGTTTELVVAHVIIEGGLFNENSDQGIYCGGRNVSINHPQVRKNQKSGVFLTSRSMDVEVNGGHYVANGQLLANTYHGIEINGTNTTVNGGVYLGKDGDNVAVDADYTALTAITRYGIEIGSTAAGQTVINWPTGRLLASHTVHDNGGASGGSVVINQVRAGNPNTGGAYGMAGSLYVRPGLGISDTGHESIWVKVAGNRATPTSGWQLLIPFSSVTALPTATSALRGYTLRLTAGVGSADALYVCIKDATESYVWKQITVS